MPQCITHGEKVIGVVRQGHLFRPPQHKVRRQFGPGDSQHACARIKAGDVVGRAKDLRRLHRHQSGASGHIEQVIWRPQAVLLEGPAPVGGAAAKKAPVHHGIVMLRPLVEQPVDEFGLGLGRGVVGRECGMGKHAN